MSDSAVLDLIGGLGDALSAPRRAVWGALGLPEHGSQAVANLLGVDPQGLLAKGLGLGAEVLGDPLTYATMGLGAGAAKLGTRALGQAGRGLGGIEVAAQAGRSPILKALESPETASAVGLGRAAGAPNSALIEAAGAGRVARNQALGEAVGGRAAARREIGQGLGEQVAEHGSLLDFERQYGPLYGKNMQDLPPGYALHDMIAEGQPIDRDRLSQIMRWAALERPERHPEQAKLLQPMIDRLRALFDTPPEGGMSLRRHYMLTEFPAPQFGTPDPKLAGLGHEYQRTLSTLEHALANARLNNYVK